MTDRQDIVELSGREPSNPRSTTPPTRDAADAGANAGERPFLRLWFACSSQYTRAYKSDDAGAYVGRCPTCHKCIRFPVGQGGTSQRSFTVSCQ